jgi:TatD DNase family protein
MDRKVLPEEFNEARVKDLGWIDVHTHLNFLDISPEEAIRVATEQGVNRFITIGTEPQDWPVVLQLAEKYDPHVFCTLGMHPHEGKIYTTEAEEFLMKNLNHPRVVAVGEMGLDYYYDNSPREDQLKAFRAQMDLAEHF